MEGPLARSIMWLPEMQGESTHSSLRRRAAPLCVRPTFGQRAGENAEKELGEKNRLVQVIVAPWNSDFLITYHHLNVAYAFCVLALFAIGRDS